MFNLIFILDSVAIVYICCIRKVFLNYKVINYNVYWGGASKILVKGKGDLIIGFKDTNRIILLKNVYFILQFKVNLLSLSRLVDCIIAINITIKTATFRKNNDNRILSTVNEKAGLYYLNYIVKKPKANIFSIIELKKILV